MQLQEPAAVRELPRALSPLRRTSRRLARVGMFSLDTLSRLRTASLPTWDDKTQELEWVAENMAALHGLRVTARGHAPRGPTVFVANHVSYLDPVAICSQIPVVPLAKREVSRWPVIGTLAHRLGVMFVDRGCAHSGARVLRQALQILDRGASILVFPEGTTTTGSEVLPMLRGVFGVARLADVPVVPVALAYDHPGAAWVGDASFVPHYVRTTARPCTHVDIEFLPPLAPLVWRTAEALADAARTSISAALAGHHRPRRPALLPAGPP